MDGVPCACWNEDGIAWADRLGAPVDLDCAVAFHDPIKFFGELVVMSLSVQTDGEVRFCEALVLNGGVAAIQKTANGGAVLGGEGGLPEEVSDDRAHLEKIE